MTTHAAYCAPCDMQVEVEIDSDRGEFTAEDVSCPALGDSCRPATCMLGRISPAQLRDQLQFIPPSGTEKRNRGFEEAARMVERGRRRSMSREAERLRDWWDRVRPH
ncbi:MAG: hypothetical protein Q8W44_01525 [Candidatus Palauibacterales bacterium]|nr:hypothetical protein [Candidatus Palauibacterales bacterium]